MTTKSILLPTNRQKFTPPEIARAWGIDPEKVLNWIRSGHLRAIDGATPGSQRPRYLIDRVDLAAFEESRTFCPREVSE